MATKITILGEEPTEKKELKKIEFVHFLSNNLEIDEASTKPRDWGNVELVRKKGRFPLDIMFAYDDNREAGCLYLGHFNDGVV